MLIYDEKKFIYNNTLSVRYFVSISELVEHIDSLQSCIKDYSLSIQSQIIDCAFNKFYNDDFIDFVSYEFNGDELLQIHNKYFN